MDTSIAAEENIMFLKSESYPYLCVSKSNMKNHKVDTESKPIQIVDKRNQPIELLHLSGRKRWGQLSLGKKHDKSAKRKMECIVNFLRVLKKASEVYSTVFQKKGGN